MRARLLTSVLLSTVLASGPALGASRPDHGSPAWYGRSAGDRVGAEGRGVDQLRNPDFASRFWPRFVAWQRGELGESDIIVDPYRVDWGRTRGNVRRLSFRNRYGARLSAHLWWPRLPFRDPVTGVRSSGPFPAVVLVNGGGAPETPYWWAAQGLAEAGYVVLTFDPQGYGESESQPNPRSTYCDPDGAWREPQEYGLREHGSCAGVDEFPPGDPVADAAALLRLRLGGLPYWEIAEFYRVYVAKYVFSTLDAVSWLLSAANPKRSLIDGSRVGVAGHSAGAWGAMVAGNGDPRFAAAVTWDGYGLLPPAVSPRVPTMVQAAEAQNVLGPYTEPPPLEGWTPAVNAHRFRSTSVDTALLTLRASTHQEWAWLPYGFPIPPFYSVFGANASSEGQSVALYYTLAWFDRYLKGLDTGVPPPWGDPAAYRADATRRLRTRAFDASADRVTFGQGTWDPVRLRNAPYSIEGDDVGSHLSMLHPSFAALDGFRCSDLQRGC